MDDQGATLDRLYLGIRQNVAVEINLQQRGGGHLGKHPVRALDQHAARFARHPKPEMIVGQIVDPVMRQHAVPGREFDAGRPLFRADLIAKRFSFGDELNGHNAVYSAAITSSSSAADKIGNPSIDLEGCPSTPTSG